MKLFHKPERLREGDTVALLSPGSPPRSRKELLAGAQALRRLGLQVVVPAQAGLRHGYLAGKDKARANAFLAAWADPKIRAIFAARGGYGCGRMLSEMQPRLDLRKSKIVIGFSDVTLLHLYLQRLGYISFWGPMPASSLGLNMFASQWLKALLMQPAERMVFPIIQKPWSFPRCRGTAIGRITGGTLSLLCASLGTPYALETKNRLLFIEDTGEEPYKIDRMLTQLGAAGLLQQAAGFLVGAFTDASPKVYSRGQSFSVLEVLQHHLGRLGKPILGPLPLGHIPNQWTLPYGCLARISTAEKSLTLLESPTA
jgi:muramoyltetrapeptide carboxypeptidase